MPLPRRTVLLTLTLAFLAGGCGLAQFPAPTATPDTIPGAAGYALPILDLDGDAARQVVVDREEGQYLGHVTTVLLDDGATMIAVYPKGHGKGAIVMKRSSDGGRTWSERLPVPESWATSQEVPTIFPIRDAAGGIERLIMFSGLAPIRMAVSEDLGDSWSELEAIGDYGGIVACATLTRLKDGSHLALFHDDGRFIGDAHRPDDGNRFHVYAIRSTDGGLSWGAPEVVATHPRAHLCEPLLLRSPDGGQLLCLMRENSRQFNGFYMTSDDEGATWSEPHQMSAALTGDRHTGGYAPDGRLFLSFRDTARRSPTQGDWVGWVGSYDDIVSGRDGQYRVRLKDNKHRWDCAYPGVERLPDGSFIATTYGHWDEGQQPYILSTRLSLDELDRMAARAGGEHRIDNPANRAILPVPRDMPSWQERATLLDQRAAEAAATGRGELIFLGDSITQGWEADGKEAWAEHFAPRGAVNFGISGDRTQHVLWRIQNGNLEGLDPKLAVLMIGTNNSNEDPGADIADGIHAILRELRAARPDMRILVLDIFARGAAPDDRLRKINDEANRLIQLVADDPMIEVMDLDDAFLEEDGTLTREIMPDLLHLSEEGYRRWAEAIAPRVAALLGEG
jgi:lysophospholipase L1-like esterase